MSPVKLRWKSVILTALVLTEALLALFYPFISVTPESKTRTRRLMADVGAGSYGEERVRQLQEQLYISKNSHDSQISNLQKRIKDLKHQLESQKQLCNNMERRNFLLIEKMAEIQSDGHQRKHMEGRMAPRITSMDLRTMNIRLNSEFEVIFYTHFNKDYLYSLDSGMSHKPEQLPAGHSKSDRDQVLKFTLNSLNTNQTTVTHIQSNDYLFGHMRTDKTKGSQYELYYKTDTKHVFQHVSVFRPFAPLQLVTNNMLDKSNVWINMIMPLQGRLETLAQFLDMFMPIVTKDQHIFFTLVYFGGEGKKEALALLTKAGEKYQYNDYKLIEKEGNFTRGGGLLAGAEAWTGGNVLMFFCDVDIYFTSSFIDHCRLNTAPAAKVYYPIVFSLYNPELVYHDEPEIPKLEERLVIHRESGFWRTFGFGMACMYRSDFIFHKGFDTTIQGWGWEDVQLFRKLISSHLEVIRSPDPAIFHIWHEKYCDTNLPPKQYTMCLKSKAMADGSIRQLGMLAYGHEMKADKKIEKDT